MSSYDWVFCWQPDYSVHFLGLQNTQPVVNMNLLGKGWANNFSTYFLPPDPPQLIFVFIVGKHLHIKDCTFLFCKNACGVEGFSFFFLEIKMMLEAATLVCNTAASKLFLFN